MTWLAMIGAVYLLVSLILTGVLVCIFAVSGRTNKAPERPSKSTAEPANEVVHGQQVHVPNT